MRTHFIALSLLVVQGLCAQQRVQPAQPGKNMEVAVWDTYVKKKDGTVMHFDIIAPTSQRDTLVIHGYGRDYLRTKGQDGQPLTAKECRFCHVREVWPQWKKDISDKGYFILEMEGCD